MRVWIQLRPASQPRKPSAPDADLWSKPAEEIQESRYADAARAQFKSPLILILIVAVGLSFFFNESIDARIIIAIILLSSVKALLSIVKMDAIVLRNGAETSVSHRTQTHGTPQWATRSLQRAVIVALSTGMRMG